MSELSHVDDRGKARMVNIGNKPIQYRRARATGKITLQPATVALIRENEIQKGDVLTVSEIAGIQGGKRTSSLIPLCHPLGLTQVLCRATLVDDGVEISAEASCRAMTGVEMEALTAVGISLLTVYDMCKAVDKEMVIRDVRLVDKIKSDDPID